MSSKLANSYIKWSGIKDIGILLCVIYVAVRGWPGKNTDELKIGDRSTGREILLSTKAGKPSISVMEGKDELISAGTGPDGSTSIVLKDRKTKSAVSIMAGEGGPVIVLFDKRGKRSVLLGSLYDLPGLVVLKPDGTSPLATVPSRLNVSK